MKHAQTVEVGHYKIKQNGIDSRSLRTCKKKQRFFTAGG
jgi:hypothetical protein